MDTEGSKQLTKEASQELEVKDFVIDVKVESKPPIEPARKVFVLPGATLTWRS